MNPAKSSGLLSMWNSLMQPINSRVPNGKLSGTLGTPPRNNGPVRSNDLREVIKRAIGNKLKDRGYLSWKNEIGHRWRKEYKKEKTSEKGRREAAGEKINPEIKCVTRGKCQKEHESENHSECWGKMRWSMWCLVEETKWKDEMEQKTDERRQRKRWMTSQRKGGDRTELMKECIHKGHTNNSGRWLQWQRITVIDPHEQEKFRFHKQLCWILMSHVNTINLRRIQIGSIQRGKVSEGKQTRDLVCGTGNINKEPY